MFSSWEQLCELAYAVGFLLCMNGEPAVLAIIMTLESCKRKTQTLIIKKVMVCEIKRGRVVEDYEIKRRERFHRQKFHGLSSDEI